MSRPAKLPPGVIRACAGLLESEEALSLACRRAIQAAENAVGSDYLPEAEQQRRQLIQAIKRGDQVIAEVAPAFVGQFGPLASPEKVRAALTKILNEGDGGMICILL